MMGEQYIDHGQTIGRSAERQMRQWALSFQVEEQRRREQADTSQPEVHPYVAISRETGALGSKIAARIGQQLGWQVLDRELLNYMVQHFKLASDMLEFVDETTSNWLIEILGKWLSRQMEGYYNLSDNLLNNYTCDPNTLSARFYEAARLDNYKIDVRL